MAWGGLEDAFIEAEVVQFDSHFWGDGPALAYFLQVVSYSLGCHWVLFVVFLPKLLQDRSGSSVSVKRPNLFVCSYLGFDVEFCVWHCS